jgi:omega-6 fatty acid desaturase (delta-12 desaturase)
MIMNDSKPATVAQAEHEAQDTAAWKAIVARYQRPALWRGIWQILNTLVPYAGLWYLMYWSLSVSYWLTVPLALIASGLLVRVFIIFHDCGHGSFFKSRLANDVFGCITGVLCFTPYYRWRWEHAVHHSTSGDLDRRGTGDVWTLTVQEYLESSRWKKFSYRLARNPFILFVVAPLALYLVIERLPKGKCGRRERWSVHWTNLLMVLVGIGMSQFLGWKAYVLLQLCVIMVAGSAGVWLFYVQHQFEDVYWERREHWDYVKAALQGSSFYKLPRLLQWFSGNIGFHHIHHLSPRIPNYHLERCHRSEPLFQNVKAITLLSSLKSFSFRLWDEQRGRMVGYSALARARLRMGSPRQR